MPPLCSLRHGEGAAVGLCGPCCSPSAPSVLHLNEQVVVTGAGGCQGVHSPSHLPTVPTLGDQVCDCAVSGTTGPPPGRCHQGLMPPTRRGTAQGVSWWKLKAATPTRPPSPFLQTCRFHHLPRSCQVTSVTLISRKGHRFPAAEPRLVRLPHFPPEGDPTAGPALCWAPSGLNGFQRCP